MGIETAVAVIGLVIAGAGAYSQHEAGQDQKDALKKQGNLQREQFELERRKADIESARNARSAVRQARIARASIINAGADSGTLTSSGVQGGASSVGSQLEGNLDFFNTMHGLNEQIISTQAERGDAVIAGGQAQADSAKAGAIGAIGGTVFGAAGGFKTIFSESKTT